MTAVLNTSESQQVNFMAGWVDLGFQSLAKD
jgi:hypothetical protein